MKGEPYREVRGIGLDWMAGLPSHWSAMPLKYLVNFESGGTPSKDNPLYWGGDIPWASAKDLKQEVISDTIEHLTDAAISEGAAKLVARGTVAVVVRGMILARTFPVSVLDAPMAINQDLKALSGGSRLDTRFLAWALRGSSEETLARLEEAAHGTKALRMDAWSSMCLPVPPLPEQFAIAAFLDRETAKIDTLIAEQQRLIALLDEKRRAVISHAVTKGLNPDAPMKHSGIEWLGEVPAHWRLGRLKDAVLSVEQGWSPQCESYPAGPGEWGVLKVGCVNGGSFNSSENKALPPHVPPISELSLRYADILISRANTRELVGSAAMVDRDYDKILVCDKLFRCRTNVEMALPEFIVSYLGSKSVRAHIELSATGASSSMLNIGRAVITDMPLALPPLDEQTAMRDYISLQSRAFADLAGDAKLAVSLLQERRSALISAAVTGKIDVRRIETEAEAA